MTNPAYETIQDIETFVAEVFEGEGPVVVDFWAEWCGPCRAFAPVFARSAAAHPDVRFVKVNTEKSPDIAQAAGIRSLPTIGFYWKGKLVDVAIGAQSPPAFERSIKRLEDKVAGRGFLSRLFSKG